MGNRILAKAALCLIAGAVLFSARNAIAAEDGAVSQPQDANATAVSQDSQAPTEQLWGLVHSLHQLRSEYYQRQNERTEKIRRLGETAYNLEKEVEDLRSRENEIDKNLEKLRADIDRLRGDIEKNKAAQAVDGAKLERFISQQGQAIENGIPCRQDERLARLKGTDETGALEQEKSNAAVFSRIWNFSQEELRMARSGETFSEEIDLGGGRMLHARVFRAGHLAAGYLTEDGTEAGIWRQGRGWEKAGAKDAEAVKAALDIFSRRGIPRYIEFPLLIGPVETAKQESKEK